MAALFGLFVVVGALALAAVVLKLVIEKKLKSKGRAGPDAPSAPRVEPPPPYRATRSVLSPADLEFFRALVQAVGPERHVLAKVRLEDLLWLPRGTENRQSHRNRVSSRHIDFVVCDRATMAPRTLIELDDASHGREDRISRDEFVDGVCREAGLRIVRAPAKRGWKVEELAGMG